LPLLDVFNEFALCDMVPGKNGFYGGNTNCHFFA
jgi:hypothetical protein